MTRICVIAGLVVCLALTACGSAPANPTPAAPAELPTSAPQQTVAPSATVAPTTAPTPTSAPGVISSADQLGLAADFVALPKDDVILKVPPELLVTRVLIEDPKNPFHNITAVNWLQFPVKASFAFAKADNKEFVYGYTVTLSDSKDQATFDSTFVEQLYAIEKHTLIYTQDSAPLKDVAVGDKSGGLTTKLLSGSWGYNVVSFRVGSTGAFVFTIYPGDAQAPIDVVKLAQACAATLK
jgi:hypothetical protein